MHINIQTNLSFIALLAIEKEAEHDQFRVYLKQMNSDELDEMIFPIQEEVTAAIDCTSCGACCKSLMINVTAEEASQLSSTLGINESQFRQQYLEESMEGQLIINQVPCHFLEGSKCSIYQNRFIECREFPHLHKKGFQNRLFGTLMHYGTCPIVFNSIEALKTVSGFHASL
jgi:hypothetical protein